MATKSGEFRERLAAALALACLSVSAVCPAAMMVENCAVKVEADAPPVAAVVAVGDDIHLLVTNAGVSAGVRIAPAAPGWRLVEPSEGTGRLSVGSPVSYKVVEEADREAARSGMVRMFTADFDVAPDKPSGGGFLSGDLTDNHEATVSLVLSGISSLSGHSASMSVRPEQPDSIINKMGTSVAVAVDTSSLEWRTSKIYWYGVNPNGCCYYKRFNYVFELTVDGIRCASRKYNVGWPNESPRMEYGRPTGNTACSVMPAEYDVTRGCWRARVVFGEFPIKRGAVLGCPTSDQYSVETQREEEFHKMQWEGIVPVELGGSGDCFTVQGLRWFATTRFGLEDGDYAYGSTAGGAIAAACQILRASVTAEVLESKKVDRERRNFKEYHAKAYAGYNAAWKYHCCYQEGDVEVPTNVIHSAYR